MPRMTPQHFRERYNLDRAELAEMLGLGNTTTVYRWETLRTIPPPYLHLALRALELEHPRVRRFLEVDARLGLRQIDL